MQSHHATRNTTTTSFTYTEGSQVPQDVTHVIIHPSVTIIEERAFFERTSLISIEFSCSPSSSSFLTTIGRYAFSHCISLTSLHLPEFPSSLLTIGNGAFYHCTALASIHLSNSLWAIHGMAFSFCTSLTELQLPNSLTIIGNSAFSFCKSLTSVWLPKSLSTFSITAFLNCTKLATIHAPSPRSPYCRYGDTTSVVKYIQMDNNPLSLRAALEKSGFHPVQLTCNLLLSSTLSSFGSTCSRYGWQKNLYFDWKTPCRTTNLQHNSDATATRNYPSTFQRPHKRRLPLCIAASQSFRWSTRRRILQKILAANPAAIGVTDVVTGLEPFMLAAVGMESDWETVYRLLVAYPPAIGCWRQFCGRLE